jgi:hypothetical protein
MMLHRQASDGRDAPRETVDDVKANVAAVVEAGQKRTARQEMPESLYETACGKLRRSAHAGIWS